MGQETSTFNFSGQGKLSFAERNELGRAASGFTFLGDCSKLDIKCQVENKEHQEHQSGQNGIDNTFEINQKVELEFTLDEFVTEAVNLYVYGTSQTNTASTVTAETTKLYLGKESPTEFMPDGDVIVTDVGGSTTYVLGTDYKIGSTGMIYVPSSGSNITDAQDVELNYQSRDERITTAFTQLNKPYFFRFDGLNRAHDNKPVVVEIYKGRMNPAEMLDIINEDFATYNLKGKALYDPCYVNDGNFGAYFRVRVVE